MPGLQNWINLWVNGNQAAAQKRRGRNRSSGQGHSIDTGSSNKRMTSANATTRQPAASDNRHLPSSNRSLFDDNDRFRGVHESGHSLAITATTDHSAPTSILGAIDPELAAIQKFNNKKHRRRLNRTNSFSDILRQKAERTKRVSLHDTATSNSTAIDNRNSRFNEQRRHHGRTAPTFLHHSADVAYEVESMSLRNGSPTETVSTVNQSNRHDMYPYQDTGDVALLEVADFWGADRPTVPVTYRGQYGTHRGQHGTEDDQPGYLRAFLQTSDEITSSTRSIPGRHRESDVPYQRTSRSQQRSNLPANRYNHAHAHSLDVKPMPPSPSSSSTASAQAGLVFGGVRLPFFATSTDRDEKGPASNDAHNAQSTVDNNIDSVNRSNGEFECEGCKAAQVELQHTRESLEYIREIALRNEYCCSKCGSDTDVTKASIAKKNSQQLSEVTERHQRQVERLVMERTHWQRNSQLKVEKLSHLCQNMNNDSAERSERIKAYKGQLETLESERNHLLGEVEKLRADIDVHEKEREEHRRVQERMAAYEKSGLEELERSIVKRDEMIVKLSSRLTKALGVLAKNREQQLQRRQIIFPQTASKGRIEKGGSGGSRNLIDGVLASESNGSHGESNQMPELVQLRRELLEMQQKLETTQLEAKQRETSLLFRCELLEKQVSNSSNKLSKSKTLPRPPGENQR